MAVAHRPSHRAVAGLDPERHPAVGRLPFEPARLDVHRRLERVQGVLQPLVELPDQVRPGQHVQGAREPGQDQRQGDQEERREARGQAHRPTSGSVSGGSPKT